MRTAHVVFVSLLVSVAVTGGGLYWQSRPDVAEISLEETRQIIRARSVDPLKPFMLLPRADGHWIFTLRPCGIAYRPTALQRVFEDHGFTIATEVDWRKWPTCVLTGPDNGIEQLARAIDEELTEVNGKWVSVDAQWGRDFGIFQGPGMKEPVRVPIGERKPTTISQTPGWGWGANVQMAPRRPTHVTPDDS